MALWLRHLKARKGGWIPLQTPHDLVQVIQSFSLDSTSLISKELLKYFKMQNHLLTAYTTDKNAVMHIYKW